MVRKVDLSMWTMGSHGGRWKTLEPPSLIVLLYAYQCRRSANWICRALPTMLVMVPAAADPMLVLG